MATQKENTLIEALAGRASEEGIEIVDITIVGAKKAPTIRVYIDTPEGVSFDELSSSQVWINEIMDDIDPFPGAYTLEVSSPGIDRPLRTLEHFQRFAGETVVVQASGPIEGRSKWTGKLLGVEEGNIVVEVDEAPIKIAFDGVKRAHVKGTIVF